MKKRILIVEDSEIKLSALQAQLAALGSDFDIKICRNIASMYSTVSAYSFDLIVLDMAFQEGHGAQKAGWLSPSSGLEVLQHLQRRRVNVSVMVATQHTSFTDPEYPSIKTIQDLEQTLVIAFPDLFVGLVRVDLAAEDWKEHFKSMARRCLNVAAA